MSDNLRELDNRYRRLLGRRDQQQSIIKLSKSQLEEAKDRAVLIAQALNVISTLADDARQTFKKEVNQLITLVVKSVFSENFGFDLKMEIKNNRLQSIPTITEMIDGELETYTPKDDMGGSILDIIGFALRILIQKFGHGKTRPILLLDEPMKNTGHGELLIRAGNILAELSHNLYLQLIIMTHDRELAEIGEYVWSVTRDNGVSTAVRHDSTHDKTTKTPKRPPTLQDKPKRELIK
jgi:DNA repair exonuclease SbcCD ATPase subunit